MDGDEDLFIFDNQGNSNLCFENISATENGNQYRFNENWSQRFPMMTNWVQVQDYNCDGIMDILTYEEMEGNIRRFRGQIGIDNLLEFDLEADFLNANINGITTPLTVNQFDRPHFKDIDFDGDIDVLVFNEYDQVLSLIHI